MSTVRHLFGQRRGSAPPDSVWPPPVTERRDTRADCAEGILCRGACFKARRMPTL